MEPHLPTQRGNVSHENFNVVNAMLFITETGCKWRALPKRFGYTIDTRMNGWAKAGALDRLFAELQRAQLIRVRFEAMSLDSTIVKNHPDGTSARKEWTLTLRQFGHIEEQATLFMSRPQTRECAQNCHRVF